MNSSFDTPILFLIFNRLDTAQRVFDAIKLIKPRQLFIAADGYRSNINGEKEKCEAVRKYVLDNINWECEVKTLFRDKNLGCKLAVSSAIDWFFENEEQGIILEDDCLPSQSFFFFCQELLEKYKYEDQIFVISGDNFNKNKIGNADYYFSRIPNIWGWATWRRAWEKYDVSMSSYNNFKRNDSIKSIWTSRIVQSYWLNIFDKVYNNKIDTWDYQLAFSIFLNKGLCVCPNKNLISNIGFGGNFTNTIIKDKIVSEMLPNELDFPLEYTNDLEYCETNDSFINKNIFLKRYFLKIFLEKIGLFNFIRNLYVKLLKRF